MTSMILLLAMAVSGQMDAAEEKRQVHEIHLEHRLGDLDDRANHADAVYLDVLPRAVAPVSADGLERSLENRRLRAENNGLPFNRDGYVSYWLSLKRLADAYAETARTLDDAGRASLAAHARRGAELWAQRADAMDRALEQGKAESERIARLRSTGELGTQPQALRERVSPIFRLFRFLGTIPPVHAIAVFVAFAILYSRMPRRRLPPPPQQNETPRKQYVRVPNIFFR